MQRMWRQLADQWEWYATVFGRNDPAEHKKYMKEARRCRAELAKLKAK